MTTKEIANMAGAEGDWKKVSVVLTIVVLIVGAVVYAMSQFAIASTFESKMDLKYFPKENGILLEAKVSQLEEAVGILPYKLQKHDSTLICITERQKRLLEDQERLFKAYETLLNKVKP
jgi:hypothetical protein